MGNHPRIQTWSHHRDVTPFGISSSSSAENPEAPRSASFRGWAGAPLCPNSSQYFLNQCLHLKIESLAHCRVLIATLLRNSLGLDFMVVFLCSLSGNPEYKSDGGWKGFKLGERNNCGAIPCGSRRAFGSFWQTLFLKVSFKEKLGYGRAKTAQLAAWQLD
eukprot:s266_g26.t1